MNVNDAIDLYPPELIDDHLTRARTRRPGTLAATALRTRSPAARHLLARAADPARTLPALLDLARAGGTDPSIDPAALCELARVVGLQFGTDEDRRDALALYDLALRVGGPKRIGGRHRAVHAQIALALGEVDRTRDLLRRYANDMPELELGALRADLAHPDRGGDEREWAAMLARLSGQPGLHLAPATDADAGLPRYDRLRGAAVTPVTDGPKITVVTSAYRPDRGLLTAIGSLLAGSWQHLELLIVDDASGPEYDDVLDAAAALDDRVRVIRKDVNAGTFAARNTAYAQATGEFITGLDSDDWAAPERLAHSVAPLLADPELMLTYSDAFLFLDDLTVSRPGRVLTTVSTASMMIRREPVLERIGYLDEIRKGADTEYLQRAAAAFGKHRVMRLQGTWDTLMRQAPGSLSREEFGPGWKHPARRAYQSAYPLWHQRIAAGEADPRLPLGGVAERPFWAPDQVRDRTAPRHFDVVFALDWRPFGGPQKSTIEEIKALRADGRTLAITHLESWRHMTTDDRPMNPGIQRLVNDGLVEQVLPTDDVECDLLILRYPPILQFRSGERAGIRPGRMIVLANQAPHERDGSDRRYVPDACHANATAMFGVEPLWVPQGPQVREALADLTAGPLAAFDMPGILDDAAIAPARDGFRSVLPVVGRHSRDDWTKWPRAADLPLVYPGDGRWDVRVMGGVKSVRAITGQPPSPEWTCYGFNETDVESFLYQLDFWVYYPHPDQYEAFGRAVLEALAAGCVAVLPPRFEPTFGDAALYGEPSEVADLIDAHYAHPERYRAQSALAQQRVRERFSHDSYRKLVTDVLSDTALSEDHQ